MPVSHGLGDHLHGVAGTLLHANGAARTQAHIDPVSPAWPKFLDGCFRAGGITIIAFETVAAGEAAFGFVKRTSLAEPGHDLAEAVAFCHGLFLLGGALCISIDRQIQHAEADDRPLRRLSALLAAQPRIDVAGGFLAVSNGGGYRPVARHEIAARENARRARHHVRAHDHRRHQI